MASNKRDLSIPWPFAPQKVDLNTDTSLLKIVAMIAMFIDHSGKMLFPQYPIMRVIGRIAFPIYAYCIAVGCVYTKDPLKYFKRVVLLALISQPFYAVALGHETSAMYAISFSEQPVLAALNFYVQSWSHPSILLSLSLGILVIWSIRERQLLLTVALALFCWKIQGQLDYGIKGIGLMTLFYLFCSKWWISLPVLLAYMVWWGLQSSGYALFDVRFGTQMFAVLALPLIYIHTKSNIRLNKWVFYLFYPAHLIVIMALDKFLI
ncbi:MAG: TraX family protein [Candidatus Faecivicinus sp.]